MNPPRRTAAEGTAATLLGAARDGVTVLIPGAREPRVGHPTVHVSAVQGLPAIVDEPAGTPHGPALLEYEREGGGAPSERRTPSQRSLVARLRHYWFPGDLT